MNSIYKVFFSVGALTLVSGCASFSDIGDIKDARNINTNKASAFHQALAKDYQGYAIYEAESEGEWGHGGTFARKALKAAKDEAVAPETVSNWSISKARADVLNTARTAMMNAFAGGGKTSSPDAAGRAQGQFDCWVEEEAEGITDSTCMANHKAAMAKIKVPQVASPVRTPAPMTNMPGPFMVYFDFDSAKLDRDDHAILNATASAARKSGAKRITLIGHTDRAGKADYNMALSQQRVDAVRQALSQRSLAGAKTKTSFAGETSPQIKTKDGQREGMNRRVEILLER